MNILNAKKRKELQERQRIKDAEVEEERVDEHSFDELLSFINGNEDESGILPSKNLYRSKERSGDRDMGTSCDCERDREDRGGSRDRGETIGLSQGYLRL